MFIQPTDLPSFSECHEAGIVFLVFTAVVLKPSVAPGSTADLSSTFVEWKQERVCSRKPSLFSEVNVNLGLLTRSRQGDHDQLTGILVAQIRSKKCFMIKMNHKACITSYQDHLYPKCWCYY